MLQFDNLFAKYGDMMAENQSVKRLKISYIIALSLIALISIISQFIIRNALNDQQHDAVVVNISGKQRFLSQQITKNALILANQNTTLSQNERDEILKEFSQGLDLWELQNISLIHGNSQAGIPAISERHILDMFGVLEKNYTPMLNAGKKIVSTITAQKTILQKTKLNQNTDSIIQENVNTILKHEKLFLKQMNEIVAEFAKQNKQKVNALKWIELILLWITLSTLFAEVYFIFRPLTAKINDYVDGLKQTYEEILSLTEELQQMNEELSTNNEALIESKNALEIQKRKAEINNETILESITYAQHIQNAIMVEQSTVIANFKNAFILNLPKAVVSGDFYWFAKLDGLKVLVVADCTGHGVAGAFMTMIGITLLNEIVHINQKNNPKDILNSLEELLKSTLQHHQKIKNGMDIGIVVVDDLNKEMVYAGANHNLYLMRKNELIEIKGTRNAIDGIIFPNNPFTNNFVEIQEGDTFYLASDGYRDQFAYNTPKKYSSKKFRELIQNINHLPLFAQREKLEEEHHFWRGNEEQTDDILIIGFQVF